jgi:hypothetical protein
MGRSRYRIYEAQAPHFLTCTVKRGYIDDPVHWRYSSARNYAGMEGLIEVFTEWA